MNIQQFDFSVDVLQALLWEYNDAASLQTLLQKKQDWYNINQTQFWQDWYTNVFNLATANDFGLSVWSYILDLPLYTTPPPVVDSVWGFDNNPNFDNGSFAPYNDVIQLTTEEKRLILQLRYFSFVTDCSVPNVNSFFAYVFKNYGTAYVIDKYLMYCIFVFNFDISTAFIEALTTYDVLPHPAGVGIRMILNEQQIFGFDTNFNFDNGGFFL